MFKVEPKNIEWSPSSLEDEAKVLDEIVHPKDKLTEVPLNDSLNGAIAQLLTGMAADSTDMNKSFYSGLDEFFTNSTKTVDIILPVYNSLHIVEPCINAVLTRTKYPFKLIIIDDCSDDGSKNRLETIAEGNKNIVLIRNKVNKGFAASVNRGIKVGSGHYVCLLNSDVMVTDRWLAKMVLALEADPRNQIVNPATNNTAQIDVPMSGGASYLTMNKIFEKYSKHRYPEIMPTGFCFMFRRELINKIGYLDEAYVNYGEESDWWMRCVTYAENGEFKKYRAVMADDTYLFHERGSSFSALGHNNHLSLRSTAAGRFHGQWPQYSNWSKTFKPEKTLGTLRQVVPPKEINLALSSPPYRVCWVVRSADFCGGMKYIADIVNEINERGGDARVALIQRNNSSTNVLGELRSGVVIFTDEEDFLANFKDKVFSNGFVIASTAESSSVVKTLCDATRKLVPVLHVQSYEPMLVSDVEQQETIKKAFHLIPNVISSSNWITEKLKEDGMDVIATVNPGVDTKLFYPRNRASGDDRLTVMLPMISNYPFKGMDRGIELIRHLWNLGAKNKIELRILAYGVDALPELKGVATCLGALSPTRLAKLLATEVDVFIDPAHVHSYGMPALEAMACGVPVVSWNNLGIKEYAKHGKNALLFNKNADPTEVAKGIMDLLLDPNKRRDLRNNGLATVAESHDRNKLIPSFISSFEAKFSPKPVPKKIVFVTPHLRKHGGPTTILDLANRMAKSGHEVSLLSVYPDINPEVSNMTDLPIYLGPDELRPCDILITNSDNPYNSNFASSNLAAKKVLLKLSHNERFKSLEDSSLKLKWDRIVTTTKWLKSVCETPVPGWSHPPVEATRIGWYHYSHDIFNCPPQDKVYNDDVITIGMLVHQHPLKGSQESINAILKLKELYNARIKVVAVGEIPAKQVSIPNWVNYYPSLSREDMAKLFKSMDIWVGSSHTEGLGRMALENMSASVACVLSDTNCEFAVDGENCLLSPIGDIDSMAYNLTRLVQYPDLKKKIAENGYKTASLAANPKHCVEQLNAVIKSLGEVK